MKTCAKCSENKPLDEFYVRHGKLAARCKECVRASSRERHQKNGDHVRAVQKKWREANKETRAVYLAEWRKQHGHEWLEYGRAYRQENAERLAEQRKDYAKRNPHIFADGRARRRARLASVEVDDSITRSAVFERDGGLCQECKTSLGEGDRWEIDHIVPISLGGPHVWSNVRLLCLFCNRSKHDRLEGQIALPTGA